jgi:hypothetical protein
LLGLRVYIPVKAKMFISFVGRVGSRFCGELITRSEEYLVVCVCVSNLCDIETSKMRWSKADLGRGTTNKNILSLK